MTLSNPNDVLAAYFGYRGARNIHDLHAAADDELWPTLRADYRQAITEAFGAMADAGAGLEKVLGRLAERDSDTEQELARLRGMLRGQHKSLTMFFRAIADAAKDPDLQARADAIEAAQAEYIEAWHQAVQATDSEGVAAAIEGTLGRKLYQQSGTVH